MARLPRPLRAASVHEQPDPIFGARPRSELQFLPAALEIVESPPPPLPRVAALSLVALLVTAILWASLGRVDVVSTAAGRIVPAGGGKVVQPLETGTITAIRVHDGDAVAKGQILLELEPTATLADRDRIRSELAAARLEAARLRAVATGASLAPPPGADPAAVALASREARAESASNGARLASLDQQVAQHRAELQSARAEEERLRTMLPLATQRTEIFTTLQKKGYGSRLQLIDAEEKERDTERSLEVQRHKQPELQAAIQSTARQRSAAEAEADKATLAALTDARTKAASLAEDLDKAERRLNDRTLVAPVAGTVQELAVHTVGGVVEPGQTLMRVAPSGAAVEVEARLQNKDIGFVRPGMAAEIKVETFPFTRYGLIAARVVSVSNDAVSPATAAPGVAPAGERTDANPYYLVRLALARDALEVDGRRVRLSPGMAVSAEVKTGRRSVISYILSPLAKATREAGRER